MLKSIKSSTTVAVSAASLLLIDPTLVRNDAMPDAGTQMGTRSKIDTAYTMVDSKNSKSKMVDSKSKRPANLLRTFDHWTDVMDILGDTCVQEIFDHPPTSLEADCAIEIVRSRPDLMNAVLPAGFDERQLGPVLERVRDVLMDGSAISEMKALMLCKTSQAEPVADSAMATVAPIATSPAKGSSWDNLCVRFRCIICQDVLAAPVLLECGHSFCGKCIIDYHHSSDADIVLCPHCNAEFDVDALRFQISYDQDIKEEVDQTPHCDAKIDWEDRRAEYLAFKKQNEEEGAEDGATDESWLNAAVIAAVVVVVYIIMRARN